MLRPTRCCGGAIEIDERALRKGVRHCVRYDNLALSLSYQGKYGEAKSLIGRRSKSTKKLSVRIIPPLQLCTAISASS